MGQFSVEKSFLPGQLSVEINTERTADIGGTQALAIPFWEEL